MESTTTTCRASMTKFHEVVNREEYLRRNMHVNTVTVIVNDVAAVHALHSVKDPRMSR